MYPPAKESSTYLLQLKNGCIPVYRRGNGVQLLIVLHGFESNGQVFSSWEAVLGKDYVICAPDLPFHGQADWKKSSFSQADILELVLAIAKKEKAEKFTLAGFSMGARLSICLGEELKNHVERFIFLAPAGIGSYEKVPPLYLQQLLEWLLIYPGWFKLGLRIFYQLGWVSSFHKRYAEVQIFPKDRRYRLFRVFNAVLDFQTSRLETIDFWQKSTIPALIILGARDRMVPNDKIKLYFARHPNCSIVTIDAKHHLETEAAARIIHNEN